MRSYPCWRKRVGVTHLCFSLARTPDGKDPLRVDLLPGGRFSLSTTIKTEALDGTESVKSVRSTFGGDLPGTVTSVALDGKAEFLYAGTDRGQLLRWDLSDREAPKLIDTVTANRTGRPVSALSLVFGDISLAVGDADGTYSTWFPASESGLGSSKALTLIHRLSPRKDAVRTILPSPRSKTLYSLDEKGTISVDHMTSERHLLSLRGDRPVVRFAVSGKENGIIALDGENRITVWRISIPHPEVSLKTLFGKVWYENYDKPAHVWQSSSASDDFEPKLSLTPLIFGTLKGTLYAMIFAIPLALLGALYTSQFMGARLKKFVKPAIEIMAAIPSVVIGFLAGLWLAPLLDKAIVPLLVSVAVVPAAVLLSILLWKRVGAAPVLKRISLGYEFLFLIPALLIGVYVSSLLGGVLEASLFSGDFKLWLFDAFGARFDQRNSIIIAFALGLAVIPIIFTIAEDALSNVPKNLAAASLAIGASRWQTAWRVVLPSALPGIFSAVMIGFGRAVGETMIVLMATGNTPIIDWSIFNGFRIPVGEHRRGDSRGARVRHPLPGAVLLRGAAVPLHLFHQYRGRSLATEVPQEIRPLLTRTGTRMGTFWKQGEPQVWGAAAALSATLLMILLLIGVVMVNGLGYFWPADTALVSLKDGGKLLGEISDREKANATHGKRLQLKVGNRDLYGQDYRWIDSKEIQALSYPADAIVLERTEHGNFYGFLKNLSLEGLKVPASASPGERLRKALSLIADSREKFRDTEARMSRLNSEAEKLRLQIQKLSFDGNNSARIAALTQERNDVLARFNTEMETFNEGLGGLRAHTALFTDASGEEKEIALIDIVRACQPNSMGVFAKGAYYAGKIREMLFDEPRESNTEGGLFPAIFGTVMMVLLMSVFSLPFGVIAAVYLREYARDGIIVRLVRIAVNNLAGVPSIVYGVFGLGFFVYGIGSGIDAFFYPERLPTPTFGTGGILWASLTLALLTVPVVIVSTEEGLARHAQGAAGRLPLPWRHQVPDPDEGRDAHGNARHHDRHDPGDGTGSGRSGPADDGGRRETGPDPAH